MTTRTASDDLAWWRDQRNRPANAPAMRAVLARLHAWKAQHDADRAGQRNPFLLMAWDGVFGDEDGAVTEAIQEIEAALDAH